MVANLNAPVNGLRPDPAFANVVESNSYGRSRDHMLQTNASLSFFAPSAPNGSPKFFDWKRNLGVYGNYVFRNAKNNTDGAFVVPALTDLTAEWGPSGEDIRNRGSISINSSMIRNMSMSWSFSSTGARPITIRTGHDDNGDLVFNDRPTGVGRNSLRLGEVWSSYAYFSYSINFGKRSIPAQPGIMITSMGGGGAPTVQMMAPQGSHVPAELRRGHPEPDEPRHVLGLQRRDDVAVFQAADVGQRLPAHQFQRQPELLIAVAAAS